MTGHAAPRRTRIEMKRASRTAAPRACRALSRPRSVAAGSFGPPVARSPSGELAGLPGPGGEVGADGHGIGVFRARDTFADRKQSREQIAGRGRIPSLPSPMGEIGANGQGVRVLGARDTFPG